MKRYRNPHLGDDQTFAVPPGFGKWSKFRRRYWLWRNDCGYSVWRALWAAMWWE